MPFTLAQLEEQSAIARWRYVDVVFTTANTDTPVAYDFVGIDPETIRWVPLSVEGNAYIYRAARSSTRKAFANGLLWLRASGACQARLLLIVEHPV